MRIVVAVLVSLLVLAPAAYASGSCATETDYLTKYDEMKALIYAGYSTTGLANELATCRIQVDITQRAECQRFAVPYSTASYKDGKCVYTCVSGYYKDTTGECLQKKQKTQLIDTPDPVPAPELPVSVPAVSAAPQAVAAPAPAVSHQAAKSTEVKQVPPPQAEASADQVQVAPQEAEPKPAVSWWQRLLGAFNIFSLFGA